MPNQVGGVGPDRVIKIEVDVGKVLEPGSDWCAGFWADAETHKAVAGFLRFSGFGF